MLRFTPQKHDLFEHPLVAWRVGSIFEAADCSFQVYGQIWLEWKQASNDKWGLLVRLVHRIEDCIRRIHCTSTSDAARLIRTNEGLTMVKVVRILQAYSPGSR